MTDPSRRVAVVQSGPVAFDVAATLEKADSLVARAAAEGAGLVVLPETFVSGYPKGLDFGTRVGTRSVQGRELFERYAAGAIEVPAPREEVPIPRLEPGLVMNYENQFDVFDGWPGGTGAGFIDTLLVTESGLEVLSALPRELVAVGG